MKHPAVYSLSSCIHLRSQLAQPADGDAHAQNLLPLGLHPFPSAALASLHYFHESSLHSKIFDNIPIFHISTFWPFPNWKPPSEALKKFSQTSRAAQLSYLGTSIKKLLTNILGTTWGQLVDYLETTDLESSTAGRSLHLRTSPLQARCCFAASPASQSYFSD